MWSLNYIYIIGIYTYNMHKDTAGPVRAFSGHKLKGWFVLYVVKRFTVEFSGVLWGPHFSCTNNILFFELFFISPGKGVPCKRREAVVRVAGGGRTWKGKEKNIVTIQT